MVVEDGILRYIRITLLVVRFCPAYLTRGRGIFLSFFFFLSFLLLLCYFSGCLQPAFVNYIRCTHANGRMPSLKGVQPQLRVARAGKVAPPALPAFWLALPELFSPFQETQGCRLAASLQGYYRRRRVFFFRFRYRNLEKATVPWPTNMLCDLPVSLPNLIVFTRPKDSEVADDRTKLV
ncbi:hypothetical protein B0H63DRAFT_178535 [Podospora didyma]|uniref:Transmembrane protein n=1 Tax=Podospora didyma TaxID=330526 RepID=A0AAE0NP09_9PEZI|nr:hypothetical protein B0H63DRAFT_178535 [Podospora didyma]